MWATSGYFPKMEIFLLARCVGRCEPWWARKDAERDRRVYDSTRWRASGGVVCVRGIGEAECFRDTSVRAAPAARRLRCGALSLLGLRAAPRTPCSGHRARTDTSMRARADLSLVPIPYALTLTPSPSPSFRSFYMLLPFPPYSLTLSPAGPPLHAHRRTHAVPHPPRGLPRVRGVHRERAR
jgi:hypothetical protein